MVLKILPSLTFLLGAWVRKTGGPLSLLSPCSHPPQLASYWYSHIRVKQEWGRGRGRVKDSSYLAGGFMLSFRAGRLLELALSHGRFGGLFRGSLVIPFLPFFWPQRIQLFCVVSCNSFFNPWTYNPWSTPASICWGLQMASPIRPKMNYITALSPTQS